MSTSRNTFIRQGGWMVMATVLSGAFMFAVNLVANRMETAEWAVFRTLLTAYMLMSFPTVGLQVIFTQQTAAVVTERDRRSLAATARSILCATFFLWVGMVAVVSLASGPIIAALKITNTAALGWMALLGLSTLWFPVLRGLLQGAQNFAGLGWVAIIDGFGRFLVVFAVVSLGGQSAGAMAGAVAGQAIAIGFAFWMTRGLWTGSGESIEWRSWLGRAVPFTLAYTSMLVMTSIDVLFVQSVFAGKDGQYYLAAQIIGVAVVMLTTPLAAVMFPKIAESAARRRGTDALMVALGASAAIGGIAALLCSLMPELPLRILFFRRPEFWKAAVLVPWFAWALVPIIVTNVLVNNLMARGDFGIAPWLALLASGYVATLLLLRERLLGMELFSAFRMVILTLAAFGLAMLVAAIITTRGSAKQPGSP
ncbi:MAG: hypothetical protein EXS30_04015 [Pedosphaera sp.]|nr:hypothetical protein [Pedosphaera sp.]